MIRNYVLIFIFGILFLPTLITYIPEFDENNKIIQDQNHLDTTHLRLPFIQNQGQIPSEYKYYAKTFAGTVYVTDSDLTYYSIKNENNTQTTLVIKEKFLGNSLHPQGNEKSESVVNYFKGTQDNWKTNIPTYNYVSLGQIWDNVDVDLKAHGNNMEKIFTIHPGGNPSDIKMSFNGISSIGISENELKIDTDLGDVFLSKPIGYQIIDGKKHDVPVYYDVLDSTTYGFSVGSFDSRFPLVIDPLIASTFVGGTSIDSALYDLAIDSSGNVYITGYTSSTDYPTVSGYDSSHNGSYDAFVSKLNSNLSSLSASTFIGGSADDISNSISLDSSGNVYITGYTSSTDYPTVSGYDSSHNGGDDAFVSKLNSNLSSLSASTFIGGSADDISWDMTLDSSGNVYITGETNSTGYPTVSGVYDTSFNGGDDAFVSKLNSNLSSLSASTFIGGHADEISYGITLDSSGNVYTTGKTNSPNYPTVSGYDSSHNGSYDAFVSKLNSNLSSLSASTFIGASVVESSVAIALDSSSNVYITGYTNSTSYPTVSGAYDSSYNGGNDAFVSKLNSNLSSLSASTFIGSSGHEFSEAIAIDSSGNVYITGETNSTSYPTVSGVYDTSFNGGNDAFVSKLNSNLSSLSASTFIGGSAHEFSAAIALDSSGNVYITGETESSGYPTVSGYDSSFNGVSDVFVSYFDCSLSATGSACTAPTLTVSPTAAITNGTGGFTELAGANGITTVVIGGNTYALVASGDDDGVQIINITTPSSPTATAAITDGATFTELDGAEGITTVVIGGNTYALVASFDDDGVQIINITTPSSPTATATIEDGVMGFTELYSANGITTVVIGGNTYALVASHNDDGVQIIKLNTGGFSNTEVVSSGGESTVTLPQNTAGSTNTVVIDLPTGVAATISVSVTDRGTNSDSAILFLGQILDVDISNPTTASFTYQVRITFTDADLTAAGLSLSNVVMYRDANENGSFETNESLTTTITPSSSPGPYTATADVPANSKFSIGGVAGSVTANAAAGISAVGHSLGLLLKDNCDESGFGNGESLRIYEISYDKCDANQITILADTTCGPMNIRVEEESNMNLAGISSEQPYLNDEKRMIVLSSPITSEIMDFSVIAQDK